MVEAHFHNIRHTILQELQKANVSIKVAVYWFTNKDLFDILHQKLKRFKEDENNLGFYRRTNVHLKCPRNIPWVYKILNTLDFITNNKMNEEEINILIKKRNDLIHANITTGDKFEIDINLLKSLNSIIFNGLMNVK